MDNINNLICFLIAIQNFCKDIHYNSKGDAFYSKHLLADRVQEELSQYIDDIKEVFFMAVEKEPLPSKEYLKSAVNLIPDIAEDDRTNFESLKKLIFTTLQQIEGLESLTKGEENLIGAIAQNLQSSLALVSFQIKE